MWWAAAAGVVSKWLTMFLCYPHCYCPYRTSAAAITVARAPTPYLNHALLYRVCDLRASMPSSPVNDDAYYAVASLALSASQRAMGKAPARTYAACLRRKRFLRACESHRGIRTRGRRRRRHTCFAACVAFVPLHRAPSRAHTPYSGCRATSAGVASSMLNAFGCFGCVPTAPHTRNVQMEPLPPADREACTNTLHPHIHT